MMFTAPDDVSDVEISSEENGNFGDFYGGSTVTACLLKNSLGLNEP